MSTPAYDRVVRGRLVTPPASRDSRRWHRPSTPRRRRKADPVATIAFYFLQKPEGSFGLWPKKGALMVGADGDSAVIEAEDGVFDAAASHDGLCWSRYDGETFTARVTTTLVRGEKVRNAGCIYDRPDLAGTFPARPHARPDRA